MSANLLQVVKAELKASPSTWLLTLEDGGVYYHNTAISGEIPFYVAPGQPSVELDEGEEEEFDFVSAPSEDKMSDEYPDPALDEYPDDVGQDPGLEDPHMAEEWRQEEIEFPDLSGVMDLSNVIKHVLDETMELERRQEELAKEVRPEGKRVNALPSHSIVKSVFYETTVQFEDNSEEFLVNKYDPGKFTIRATEYGDLVKAATLVGSYVGLTPRLTIRNNLSSLNFRYGSLGRNTGTYTGNFQVTKISIESEGDAGYLLTVE